MASKRQKQAGWKLPPVIEGHDLVCYCVPIPNTREYRAAFIGQVKALGKWFNWEKSYTPGDTRATTAAMMFRELHRDLDMVSCNSFDLRQNPVNACQIEKSLDGGLTWELAWDSSLCEPVTLTYRYNPDTGIYESSADGGTTWEDATATDGRFNSPTSTLPNVGDLRCISAENVTDFLQKTVGELIATLENGGNAIAFMGVIIAIFATILSVGIALPLAITLITKILSLSSEQMEALFTPAFWDEMKCFVYCRGRSDGKYTFSNWQSLSDEVEADFPTAAGFVIKHLFWLMGASGLTNAGASGTGTGTTCGDCDCGAPWVYIWSNDPDPLPLSTYAGCSWDAPNRWYEGTKTCGWNSASSTTNVNVLIDFPTPVNIIRLKQRVQNQVAEPFNAREQYILVKPVDGAEYKVVQMFQAGTGTWLLDSGEINVLCESIRFVTSAKLSANRTPENTNFTRLKEIEIQGTGVNPFD